MLNVGLIGPGPDWETRYRPALANLRGRLRVRSVYAPVHGLALQVAAELECEAAAGLVSLVEQPGLRAVIVLDTAWCGDVPVRLACAAGKPAFLASRLGEGRAPLRDLCECACAADVTLMPELAWRYTPATARLRELMATKLGRPIEISLSAGTPVENDRETFHSPLLANPIAEWIDWCCSIVGIVPAEIRHISMAGGSSGRHILFRQPSAGGEPPRATIRCHANGEDPGFQARIRCAKGVAELVGPSTIRWEAGAAPVEEKLTGDRRAVELMLDHFARRVVGGLIPVPTLEDACRALELAGG
jgi:predicted dehydrogenase